MHDNECFTVYSSFGVHLHVLPLFLPEPGQTLLRHMALLSFVLLELHLLSSLEDSLIIIIHLVLHLSATMFLLGLGLLFNRLLLNAFPLRFYGRPLLLPILLLVYVLLLIGLLWFRSRTLILMVQDNHHVIYEFPLIGVSLGRFLIDVWTYFAEGTLIRVINTDL